MSCVGLNLSQLRMNQPEHKFSIATTLKISVEAVMAVHAVHDCGFIHWDIKPPNVAMGDTLDTAHTLYILDFGKRVYIYIV